MMGICPNCGEKYSYNEYDTDYLHKCNSKSETLNEEDVPIIGDYIDEETNNTISKPKLAVALQGIENKFQGTRAGIEGEKYDKETSRGNRDNTHRQRQHYESIKLGGN